MLEDVDIHDYISKLNFDVTLEPSLQQAIHRDVGLHHKRLGNLNTAIQHFEDALELKDNAYRALIERTRCMHAAGDIHNAEAKAERCLQHYPDSIEAQNHRNDCVYDQNRYEESLAKFYNTYYAHEKVRTGRMAIDMVSMTIDTAIGAKTTGCLQKMSQAIESLQRHDGNVIDTEDRRPLPGWKVLRANNACDVVSVKSGTSTVGSAKIDGTPIQRRRIELSKRIKHSTYLGTSTTEDLMFLKSLANDRRVNLRQTPKSSQELRNIINESVRQVDHLEDMLYKRQPMYAKRMLADVKKVREQEDVILHRLQARARREAFENLAAIKGLHAAGDTAAMLVLIEKVMSDFFPKKTKRVLPRKFDFICEIYNLVGLVYMNRLHVPSNLFVIEGLVDRMCLLLQIPGEKKITEEPSKMFGDRTGQSRKGDVSYLVYKRQVDHFDYRLRCTSYPIERCYIYHEMANLHVGQRKLEEAKQVGKKLIDQAAACNSRLWLMLGNLALMKVKTLQSHFMGVAESLDILTDMLGDFDESFGHFVQTAVLLNDAMTEEARLANISKSSIAIMK